MWRHPGLEAEALFQLKHLAGYSSLAAVPCLLFGLACISVTREEQAVAVQSQNNMQKSFSLNSCNELARGAPWIRKTRQARERSFSCLPCLPHERCTLGKFIAFWAPMKPLSPEYTHKRTAPTITLGSLYSDKEGPDLSNWCTGSISSLLQVT